MADILLSPYGQVIQRFRDMGDGTWAKVVAQGTGTSANQVQGNVASGATDSGNPVKMGGLANSGIPTAVTVGQRVDGWYSLNGSPIVGMPNLSGTDNFGNTLLCGPASPSSAGTARVLAVADFMYNGTSWDRAVKSNATARLLSSAATTNASNVKGSAGNVYRIRGNNTVASKRYLKLYNKATAPTVGTDTPVLTFVLLASAAFDLDLGPNGHYFATGIGYAITGAAADADTTNIGAGDIECLNMQYA